MKFATSLGLAVALTIPSVALTQATHEQEVRTTVLEFAKRFSAQDIKGTMALYSTGPGVTTIGDGSVTPGRWPILKRIEKFNTSTGPFELKPDSAMHVTLIGDRAAVAVFEYTLTMGGKGSGTPTAPTTSRGAMSVTLERTAKGWRVVNDHASSLSTDRAGRRSGGQEKHSATGVSPARVIAGPRGQTRPCVVSRVSDGDTIMCKGGVRVRLIGIDAPEMSQKPYGDASRNALERLLPVGKEVRLETDVERTDQFGRDLAYVWRDSLMVNRALVRAGWATLYTRTRNVAHAEELALAERQAREAGVGLWANEGFNCAPAGRRGRKCE